MDNESVHSESVASSYTDDLLTRGGDMSDILQHIRQRCMMVSFWLLRTPLPAAYGWVSALVFHGLDILQTIALLFIAVQAVFPASFFPFLQALDVIFVVPLAALSTTNLFVLVIIVLMMAVYVCVACLLAAQRASWDTVSAVHVPARLLVRAFIDLVRTVLWVPLVVSVIDTVSCSASAPIVTLSTSCSSPLLVPLTIMGALMIAVVALIAVWASVFYIETRSFPTMENAAIAMSSCLPVLLHLGWKALLVIARYELTPWLNNFWLAYLVLAGVAMGGAATIHSKVPYHTLGWNCVYAGLWNWTAVASFASFLIVAGSFTGSSATAGAAYFLCVSVVFCFSGMITVFSAWKRAVASWKQCGATARAGTQLSHREWVLLSRTPQHKWAVALGQPGGSAQWSPSQQSLDDVEDVLTEDAQMDGAPSPSSPRAWEGASASRRIYLSAEATFEDFVNAALSWNRTDVDLSLSYIYLLLEFGVDPRCLSLVHERLADFSATHVSFLDQTAVAFAKADLQLRRNDLQSESAVVIHRIRSARKVEVAYFRLVEQFWGGVAASATSASLSTLIDAVERTIDHMETVFKRLIADFPRSPRALREYARHLSTVYGKTADVSHFVHLADRIEEHDHVERTQDAMKASGGSRYPAARRSLKESMDADAMRSPSQISSSQVRVSAAGKKSTPRRASSSRAKIHPEVDPESGTTADGVDPASPSPPSSRDMPEDDVCSSQHGPGHAFSEDQCSGSEHHAAGALVEKDYKGDQESQVSGGGRASDWKAARTRRRSDSKQGDACKDQDDMQQQNQEKEDAGFPSLETVPKGAFEDKSLQLLRFSSLVTLILLLVVVVVVLAVSMSSLSTQKDANQDARSAGLLHWASISGCLYAQLLSASYLYHAADPTLSYRELSYSNNLLQSLTADLYPKRTASSDLNSIWNTPDLTVYDMLGFPPALGAPVLNASVVSLYDFATEYVTRGKAVELMNSSNVAYISSQKDFRYLSDNSFFFSEGFPQLADAYITYVENVLTTSQILLITLFVVLVCVALGVGGVLMTISNRRLSRRRTKRLLMTSCVPSSDAAKLARSYTVRKTHGKTQSSDEAGQIEDEAGASETTKNGGVADSDDMIDDSSHRASMSELSRLSLFFFLVCICVVAFQTVSMVFALQLSTSYVQQGREVVVSAERMVFAHRLNMLCQSLMQALLISNPLNINYVYEFQRTVDKMKELNLALTEGSSQYNIPGDASRNSEHWNILYGQQCADITEPQCRGLQAVIETLTDYGEQMVAAIPAGFGGFGNIGALVYDILYLDGATNDLSSPTPPLFLRSVDVFFDDTIAMEASTQAFLIASFVICVVGILLSYPLLLRPSLEKLRREQRTFVFLLSMIPKATRQTVPELREFLNYGVLPGDDSDSLLKDAAKKGALQAAGTDMGVQSFRLIPTLKTLPEPVVCFWSNGDLEFVNDAAVATWGLPSSQSSLGLSVRTMFEEQSGNQLLSLCSSCLSSGLSSLSKGVKCELRAVRKTSRDAMIVSVSIPAPMFFDMSSLSDKQADGSGSSSSATALAGNRALFTAFVKDVTAEKRQEELLSEEKARAEELLYQMIPKQYARRLKNGERRIADFCEHVSVLFADIVGFTSMSSSMAPASMVTMLDDLFRRFDSLAERHEIVKIKNIGDCIMCCCGIYNEPDHAERCINFGLDLLAAVQDFNKASERPIAMRVGISSGPVVVGIVGSKMPVLDVFSDTCNMASRMESTSRPGRVQISRSCYQYVYNKPYAFEEVDVDVKGKGMMQAYLLKAT